MEKSLGNSESFPLRRTYCQSTASFQSSLSGKTFHFAPLLTSIIHNSRMGALIDTAGYTGPQLL